jgi:hypothetical protein
MKERASEREAGVPSGRDRRGRESEERAKREVEKNATHTLTCRRGDVYSETRSKRKFGVFRLFWRFHGGNKTLEMVG